MNDCLLSSDRMDWETPQAFFDKLNNEFHFVRDAASSERNHKCPIYWTKQDDALSKDWKDDSIFCNPPYGRTLKKWVKKAYEEHLKWGSTIVLLIPARTDTSYFHDYILGKAEIRFIRGRLKFTLNGKECDSAPFPSMVVIYK